MQNEEKKTDICYSPFCLAEIDTWGNVHPCCPRYTNFYAFGNIYDQTFDEIWHSEKAEFFRNKILNQDYSLCNRDICMEYKNISVTEEQRKNPETIIQCKHLRLAYDVCCNVACITCRDKIRRDRNKRKDEIYEKILPVLQNLETIQVNNAGDVFSSPHSRQLVQKITSNFPHIRFIIDTNLTLCSESMYKKLGLEGKVKSMHCSIPGYSQKTYDKIVRAGNWKHVMKNLRFIVSEKDKGNIEDIAIIMVFHKYNYMEMPKMAKLAKDLGIITIFSAYQPWKVAKLADDYENMAVFRPSHKNFKDFLLVISHKDMYGSHIQVEPFLEELRKDLKPWKYDLIKNARYNLLQYQ